MKQSKKQPKISTIWSQNQKKYITLQPVITLKKLYTKPSLKNISVAQKYFTMTLWKFKELKKTRFHLLFLGNLNNNSKKVTFTHIHQRHFNQENLFYTSLCMTVSVDKKYFSIYAMENRLSFKFQENFIALSPNSKRKRNHIKSTHTSSLRTTFIILALKLKRKSKKFSNFQVKYISLTLLKVISLLLIWLKSNLKISGSFLEDHISIGILKAVIILLFLKISKFFHKIVLETLSAKKNIP